MTDKQIEINKELSDLRNKFNVFFTPFEEK